MIKYIYKYLSFPAFVDMIQRKSLHFVLPSQWEDTEENSFVYKWAKELDGPLYKYMTLLLINRTYAQSWTSLKESDAMWRIYSYENQAIRIKIDISTIADLEGVKAFQVIYNDNLIRYSLSEMSHSEILMKYISQKRKAFEHEKEVRLLYLDKIQEDKVEPAIRNLYFFLKGAAEDTDDLDIEKINLEELKEYIDYSNISEARKNQKVTYGHIPEFIKGVMVHPLAQQWYVDTVKMYCEINDVPFEGKSMLYTG